MQAGCVHDLELDGGTDRMRVPDRLAEPFTIVWKRTIIGLAAVGMVKVRGADRRAEQVRARVEIQQCEPVLVRRTDPFAGDLVLARADAIRGLNQDVGSFPDQLYRLAENLDIARRNPLFIPRMKMNDGRAGIPAARRLLCDLERRQRNPCNAVWLMIAAIDGSGNNDWFHLSSPSSMFNRYDLHERPSRCSPCPGHDAQHLPNHRGRRLPPSGSRCPGGGV